MIFVDVLAQCIHNFIDRSLCILIQRQGSVDNVSTVNKKWLMNVKYGQRKGSEFFLLKYMNREFCCTFMNKALKNRLVWFSADRNDLYSMEMCKVHR